MKKICAIILSLLLLVTCFVMAGCNSNRVNIKKYLSVEYMSGPNNLGDKRVYHISYNVYTSKVDLNDAEKIVIKINGKKCTASINSSTNFTVEYVTDADDYDYPSVTSCYAVMGGVIDEETKQDIRTAGDVFLIGIVMLVIGIVAHFLSMIFHRMWISYLAGAAFVMCILNEFLIEKFVAGGIILIVLFVINWVINHFITRFFMENA